MRLFFTQTKISSIYFTFLSSTEGIYHIGFGLTGKGHSYAALKKRLGTAITLEENAKIHRLLIREIRDYLAGRLCLFSAPTDIQGTAFQKRVWEAIIDIPYGQTRSYQEVAKAIGKDRTARAVGQAARANPLPLIIPCHRLIGSSGKLVGFSSGLNLKRKLLTLENNYKEKWLCPFPKPN